MQVSIKITNLEQTLKQLENLESAMEKPLEEVLFGGGQLIRSEAVKSIQTGAKSGIMYQKYNPRRQHRASAPGQAPASDTGNLVSKIRVKQKNPNTTQVESGADYSAFLEYGTSKMQPRPFLFPAFEKSRAKITQAVFNRVVTAIERLVK